MSETGRGSPLPDDEVLPSLDRDLLAKAYYVADRSLRWVHKEDRAKIWHLVMIEAYAELARGFATPREMERIIYRVEETFSPWQFRLSQRWRQLKCRLRLGDQLRGSKRHSR